MYVRYGANICDVTKHGCLDFSFIVAKGLHDWISDIMRRWLFSTIKIINFVKISQQAVLAI